MSNQNKSHGTMRKTVLRWVVGWSLVVAVIVLTRILVLHEYETRWAQQDMQDLQEWQRLEDYHQHQRQELEAAWRRSEENRAQLIAQSRQADQARREAKFIEAVRVGDRTTALNLLAAGIDINQRTGSEDTALLWAVRSNESSAARMLIELGADTNSQDQTGNTALLWAAQFGNLELVRLLVKHGADVNARSNRDNNALHRAIPDGHVEVIKYLLQKKVDVNASNDAGNTPLHLAAARGNMVISRLLLQNGADRSLSSNTNGDTPALRARNNGHEDVARLIEQWR